MLFNLMVCSIVIRFSFNLYIMQDIQLSWVKQDYNIYEKDIWYHSIYGRNFDKWVATEGDTIANGIRLTV